MNSTLRKETPDSDAVASSEDERPWPTAPSFGTLPRKENGVPGLGGGIWSTTQKRGSFKIEKAAQRNAAREAHLGAMNQPRSSGGGGFRPESTPSPSASDRSGALPFAIPLQPTPKAGRSLSHSQGQREIPHSSAGVRASSNDPTSVLPLGLLAEEVDTETDSELGGGLTHTTSHPPIGSLHRTATYPSTYEAYYGGGNARGSPIAAVAGGGGGAHTAFRGDHKLDAAFAHLSLDHPHRRAQWQTHLGWDDVANVNESRRHSLADIPTRRGSLVGSDNRPGVGGGGGGGGAFWPDGYMYDWEDEAHGQNAPGYRDSQQHFPQSGALTPGATGGTEATHRSDPFDNMKFNDKDEDGNQLNIPTMYKVPFIKIADHERTDQDKRGSVAMSTVGQWGGASNRPRKQLFIVSFKCSRVDVFYLLDNTGLFIKEGDIVIVEADRGQDLGTVQHANVTPDDARLYKRKYGEEQYKWLMMFSKNNQQGNVNPNAQLFGENDPGSRSSLLASAPPNMQGLPRDNFNNLKPKAIKRLANGHEIRMLSEKEGNEAKAKRTCQQKVAHLHLDMEILDAEWQWDFQKLIFYYYADHYINFKDLITELYRIYKTRIWLSAINPASFSQHALGQPPSGIGPGAVGGFNQQLNNTYTMMYGPDPDPYGAIPPYRIGYDTYTPNYPGIPGVANSFAPNPAMGSFQPYGGGAGAGGGGGGGSGDATPSVPPGVTPTGTAADYNFYYDRNTSEEATPKAFATPTPYTTSATHSSAANHPFYGQMYGGLQGIPSMGGGNERGVGVGGGGGGLGFGLQPPFNLSTGASLVNVAPGLGRQTTLPAPIGTRPGSGGNNAPTPTSNLGMGMGSMSSSQTRQQYASRIAPDFVPGQQYPSSFGGSSFLPGGGGNRASGLSQTPGDSPHRGNWAGLGGGDKAETMKNYLEGLQGKGEEDARADEMSRER